MRKVRHVRDLRRLVAAALFDSAEVVSRTSIRWNLAGGCQQPVNFVLTGRPFAWGGTDEWGDYHWVDPNSVNARSEPHGGQLAYDAPLFVDMSTRCRKCDWCLKQRASLWSLRARAEIHASSRTWFGTLTLRPEEHFRVTCIAESHALKRGTAFNEMSPSERFRARNAVISQELTKWLKRVRKESESRMRYCLVAEPHKSGLPHYHALIHERWLGGQVTERQLRRQWKLGHSKFNLVDNAKASWYVAKYLAKSSDARVRASVRYGQSAL